MILTSVSRSSSRRLRDVKTLIVMLNTLDKTKSGPLISQTSVTVTKGLFFVHLYGAYEHTIIETIRLSLLHISQANCKVCDIKPRLLALALNPECDTLGSMGTKRDWIKRGDLFDASVSSNIVQFDEALMPTDGKNFRRQQLESIKNTFCMTGMLIPSTVLIGKISELVDNRNAIAHGRESPITVGSRYTILDLQNRLTDIGNICVHIINEFENYLSTQEYLR